MELDEWQAAYILAGKAVPKTPMTLNEVLRTAVGFGDFVGRKSGVEPGVKTIWLGLRGADSTCERSSCLMKLRVTRWASAAFLFSSSWSRT